MGISPKLLSQLMNAVITATVAVIVNPVLRLNRVFSLRSHSSRHAAVPDMSRIAIRMFTAQAIASLPALFKLQNKGQPSTVQEGWMEGSWMEKQLGKVLVIPTAEATRAIAKHL